VHPNAELIERFYGAFAARDHETMASCYAPSVVFRDPVFVDLDYERATAMWRMFCLRGSDLVVTFGGIEAGDERGTASWEAVYTFAPTGRRVHNRIAAAFRFADGRIVRHDDSFDLYRWTRMALGPVGTALGWTPVVRERVRKTANRQLDRFLSEEAAVG